MVQEIQQGIGSRSWSPEEWTGKCILGIKALKCGSPCFAWAILRVSGQPQHEGEEAGGKVYGQILGLFKDGNNKSHHLLPCTAPFYR